MSNFRMNSEMVVMGADHNRPRMLVEKEKMRSFFPGFTFYGGDGYISCAKGYLQTNFGNTYRVKVEIPSGYPYSCPSVHLLDHTIDEDCPHSYNAREICIMKSEQWSSTLSLALVVAKAAVWLNKYDSWRSHGKIRWPGKDQHR